MIDAQNRRIGKKLDGVLVQRFVYGTALGPAAELDANGDVVARFIYATHVNVPDVIIKGDTTDRVITDHVGSPRVVVNSDTGEIVESVEYHESGRPFSDTNTDFQPFGFGGGFYDTGTQLLRFGVRDYDPAVGRFVSKDPTLFGGGDTNLYSYVMSDPINLIDPMGTDWLDTASNAVAGFGDTVSFGASRWARAQLPSPHRAAAKSTGDFRNTICRNQSTRFIIYWE